MSEMLRIYMFTSSYIFRVMVYSKETIAFVTRPFLLRTGKYSHSVKLLKSSTTDASSSHPIAAKDSHSVIAVRPFENPPFNVRMHQSTFDFLLVFLPHTANQAQRRASIPSDKVDLVITWLILDETVLPSEQSRWRRHLV
jgi:hypothetical protein